jgi:hypothetical protein
VTYLKTLQDLRNKPVATLADKAGDHALARKREGHKDRFPAKPREAIPACSDALDPELDALSYLRRHGVPRSGIRCCLPAR